MINIAEAIKATKAKEIKRMACYTNRASSIGYFVPELQGCLRRGVYERTKWTEKELPTPELALVFAEGNHQEKIIIADINQAGIQFLEQQSMFEWPEYCITGHIDGVIVDDGKSVPVEIKTMSPNIFATVNSFDDLKKKPWTRAYMAQLQVYMLMKNIDRAILLLKNKSSGGLKQIDCELDYELAEACIKTAEAVNKHIFAGTEPEKITNIDTCRDCPFKLACCPDINFGAELKITDDPGYEEKIDKYMEMTEAAKECDALHETIRARAKASAIDGELNLNVGKYLLTGKTGSNGAFRLKIESLNGGE